MAARVEACARARRRSARTRAAGSRWPAGWARRRWRTTRHASRPDVNMNLNTTDLLIADMESLRAHLGIDRWLLSGGSWGSTLALAYAERHPGRVSEIVLSGVTTSRRSEADWLYGG